MAGRLISRFECHDGAREVVAGLIGAYSEHVNAVFNDKLGPLISGDASEPTFLEVP